MREEETAGSCRWTQELPAYVLGEMPESDRAVFEEHLRHCPACVRTAGEFRSTIEALRAMPRNTASADLAEQILAGIPFDNGERRDAATRRFLSTAVLARIAAMLLLAVGIGAVAMLAIRRNGQCPGLVRDAAGSPRVARICAAEWLCRTQNDDGGWTAGQWDTKGQYAVGVSGLALLALMEKNADALKGPRGTAIRRGLDYLVGCQNEKGLLGPEFSSAPYNQGLGTLALLDASALSSNAAWRTAASRGVAFILSMQDASGGWPYLNEPSSSVNTSVSIWPLLALMRADQLGFPDVRPAIHHGLAWLRTTVNRDGLAGYRRADDFPRGYNTLTAAGAVCLLTSRSPADEAMAKAMISAVRESGGRLPDAADYYRDFFVTEALSLVGEKAAADPLRASLRARLLALQQRGGVTAGSWEAGDRWSGVGGPVYATALASMSLR